MMQGQSLSRFARHAPSGPFSNHRTRGLDETMAVRGLFAQSSLHKAFFVIKYIQIIDLVNE